MSACCRLPPGQEIEPRQLSPHPTDRIGAKCLLLTQRVDAIEKIIKHHGDHLQVLEKMHKLCLAVDQDGMKVGTRSLSPNPPPLAPMMMTTASASALRDVVARN